MGTPAYMSPEQARGEQLDARTDLFTLGVVLYEMATGKLPFDGISTATIMASILRDVPESPIRMYPELPSELGRIIDKALEKDRDMRYQSAAELRSDLKRLKRDTDSTPSVVAAATDSSRESLVQQGRQKRYWQLGVALAIVGIAIAAFQVTGPLPPPRVLSTTQITNDRRPKLPPILNDGSRLYFNTNAFFDTDPYGAPIRGGESFPLAMQLKNPRLLDISPDGSEFLVRTYPDQGFTPGMLRGPLWIVPVMGGSPRRLGDLSGSDAAWSPDG
jgi:serine/threonine protein kinase